MLSKPASTPGKSEAFRFLQEEQTLHRGLGTPMAVCLAAVADWLREGV